MSSSEYRLQHRGRKSVEGVFRVRNGWFRLGSRPLDEKDWLRLRIVCSRRSYHCYRAVGPVRNVNFAWSLKALHAFFKPTFKLSRTKTSAMGVLFFFS